MIVLHLEIEVDRTHLQVQVGVLATIPILLLTLKTREKKLSRVEAGAKMTEILLLVEEEVEEDLVEATGATEHLEVVVWMTWHLDLIERELALTVVVKIIWLEIARITQVLDKVVSSKELEGVEEEVEWIQLEDQ